MYLRNVLWKLIGKLPAHGTVADNRQNHKFQFRKRLYHSIDRKTCVAEAVSVNRLGGLYGQHTRWGVFDVDGKVPCLTASAGMGGGHIPMFPIRVGTIESGTGSTGQGHRVYRAEKAEV